MSRQWLAFLWVWFFSWPEIWLSWLVFFLALLFGFFAFKQTGMARKALYLFRQGQPEDCIVEISKESGDESDYVKGRVYRVSKEKGIFLLRRRFGMLILCSRKSCMQKSTLNLRPNSHWSL